MATITSLNMPPTPSARPAAGPDGDKTPRAGASAVAQAPTGTAAITPSLAGAARAAGVAEQRQADAVARPANAGEEGLAEAVEKLNAQAGSLNRSLRFTVDRDTGTTVIKVVDRETDEVIRQIPPEYTMEILRRMDIGAGVLLEEKA
jgi:flagellar protein FlaG